MIALFVACSVDPNAEPVVAWDRVACAQCGMLVSEPASTAVLVTRKGDALVFDDMGCLVRHLAEHAPATSRMWFHDGSGWRPESDVAFLPGQTTPMGYGFRAVAPGTSGAVSFGEASNAVLSR